MKVDKQTPKSLRNKKFIWFTFTPLLLMKNLDIKCVTSHTTVLLARWNSPLMWICRKILALKWNKSLQNSVVCLFDSAAIFVKLSNRWLTLAVSVLTSNLVLCSYFVWLYFSSNWWIRKRKFYSMLNIFKIYFKYA